MATVIREARIRKGTGVTRTTRRTDESTLREVNGLAGAGPRQSGSSSQPTSRCFVG